MITNTSVISLYPNGCGSSDNANSLPLFYNGAVAYDSLTNATVFENDDGTASIISSYGYAAWLFPSLWIDIPMSPSATGTFLVISASGTARKNFGVNIATQSNAMYIAGSGEAPVLNYTFPSAMIQTSSGWQKINTGTTASPTYNSMLRFTLYSQTSDTYPGYAAFIEDGGAKWSSFKYSQSNDLLLYSIDVTKDPNGSDTTASVVSYTYDGLAGFNNQPQNILVQATEIA